MEPETGIEPATFVHFCLAPIEMNLSTEESILRQRNRSYKNAVLLSFLRMFELATLLEESFSTVDSPV
jgi:hypothetical protein